MTQEALKLAFEKVTGIPDAWTSPALMQARNGFIQGWEASLSQMPHKPVAWVDPTTLHHLKIGLEGVHLVYETEMVNSLPLYDKPQRTWVGLTDEQIEQMGLSNYIKVVRETEAKLKEKNT